MRADAAERLTGVACRPSTSPAPPPSAAPWSAAAPLEDGTALLTVTRRPVAPDLVGPPTWPKSPPREGCDAIPVIVPGPAGTGLVPTRPAATSCAGDFTDSSGPVHDLPSLEVRPARNRRRRSPTVRLASPWPRTPYLRTSVPTPWSTSRRNVSRGLTDVAVFEVGSVRTSPARSAPIPEQQAPQPVEAASRRASPPSPPHRRRRDR